MQTEWEHTTRRSPFRMPFWLGFCVLLAIALFFLWQGHRAHFLGALPYALLLLCPLVHFFMHRGHGRGGNAHAAQEGSGERAHGQGGNA